MSRLSYNAQTAAEEVGLSASEIRNAFNAGEMEVHYRGKRALVEHDELVRWLKSLPTDKPEVGR